MRRLLIPTLAIVLLVCSLSAHAADPPTDTTNAAPRLTLAQAIETALHEHPRLRQAAADARMEEARRRRAASVEMPQLSLESSANEGPEGAPNYSFLGLAQAGIVNRAGADLTLSQTLDFGRTRHNVRAAGYTVGAARAAAEGDTLWVVLNVQRAWYDALLARDLAGLAQQNVDTRAATAHEADARLRHGLASRVDAGFAKSALAQAQAALIRARSDTTASFAGLNDAMGIEGHPTYDMVEDAEAAETTPPSLDTLVAVALAQRPDRRASLQRVHATEETLRAAQAGTSPFLKWIASGGSVNGAPATNNTYAVGVGLSWPLYTGGAVQAGILEAREKLASLRASDDELAHQIRLEVTRAWLNLTALEASSPSVDEQLKQAKDSEHLATVRYRNELGNIVEVQQAQLALVSAQVAVAKLRYDIRVARAVLRATTGEVYR